MSDSAEDIASDVAAVGRIAAVPTLLRVLCETTGMGFAAVARVTEGTWTACAVQDDIGFGLAPGGQLDVHTTLCKEARSARAPVVIDHASVDPVYRDHRTPRLYSIESYISVPIVLGDGAYFGNLCAIDPRPAKVSDPRIGSMFARFAELIGQQIDSERAQARTEAALLDARAVGELREQFIAMLGHDLRNPLSAVLACSQLLERKAQDPEIAKLAVRITTNAKRMSALIDDILDFARTRLGGELGVQIETIDDLQTTFAAAVAEASEARPGRSVTSRIDIGRAVLGDRARLRQLASILLASAMNQGASERPVVFGARIVGDSLSIEVGPPGEPVPEAGIGEVFRPDSRVEAPRRPGERTLALHLCEQIVKAHGGQLDVSPTRDGGSRFTARLPLVVATAS